MKRLAFMAIAMFVLAFNALGFAKWADVHGANGLNALSNANFVLSIVCTLAFAATLCMFVKEMYEEIY